MNYLLRKRLPPSLRTLLTDISPKEEYLCGELDSEPDTVCSDGIVLPSRKAHSNKDFLTPASPHQSQDDCTDDGSNMYKGTTCGLCKSKPSCYTCPRCNVPYCSLACYRSPDHVFCSEEFYKQSVLQEFKDMGESAAGSRRKMQEILLGLKQKADSTDGGMGSVLRDAGLDSNDQGQAEVLQLLSRLAEFQQSGQGDRAEIEGILRRLEEIGEGDDGDAEVPESVCVGDEGDEPEEGQDLADRLSGLDMDALSEEAMWELLNSQEKEGFVELMKGKGLEQLVPLWEPWWEVHEEGRSSMVEVLGEQQENVDGQIAVASSCDKTLDPKKVLDHIKDNTTLEPAPIKSTKKKGRKSKDEQAVSPASKVPPICGKIPKLTSLCSNSSPLVCYGLVNALFGYAFTLTLFNGDIDSLNHEVCDMILDISEALNSNKVFESLQQALQCGEAAMLAGGYFDREDRYAKDRAVGAVAHLMTGRSRRDAISYCLAAFSQLRSALAKAKASLPKGELEEKRRKYFLAGKKCEFYQAWVSDNGQQLRTLAIRLWQEHSDRLNGRETLEQGKRAVEDNWKKGKKMAKSTLIQEIN